MTSDNPYDQPYDPSGGLTPEQRQQIPVEGYPSGTWRDEGGILRNADGSLYTLGFAGNHPPGTPLPTKDELTGTTPPPPTNTGGPTGGGYNPPTDGPFAPIAPGPFTPPTPTPIGTAPVFTPPNYTPPPAFSYGEFQAPSYEAALNDPGARFAIGQGEDALRRSYAAHGVSDSGGAYKGLIDYGRSAGNTLYGDIFNRDLTSYQANRANAVDTYNTNYHTQFQDPWTAKNAGALVNNDNAMTGWTTNAQNTQFNNATSNTNAWNSYLNDYLIKHNNQLDSWRRLFDVASLQ